VQRKLFRAVINLTKSPLMVITWNCHGDYGVKGLISPIFYAKLSLAKITKVQKYSQPPSVFFAVLGSAHIKALRNMLLKLTPGIIDPTVPYFFSLLYLAM